MEENFEKYHRIIFNPVCLFDKHFQHLRAIREASRQSSKLPYAPLSNWQPFYDQAIKEIFKYLKS